MQRASLLAIGLIPALLQAQSPASLSKPVRIIDSIPAPERVAVGPDGAWYFSSFGKFGNGFDGAVYRVDPDKGTRELFAGGHEDPCGLLFLGSTLWVADRHGVYRVSRGKVELVYRGASGQAPIGPHGTGRPRRRSQAGWADRAGECWQSTERL